MRFVDSMFLLLEEKQLKKQINSESLEKILQILLDNFLLKGSFELEIDENCLKDLIAIDPNLTLETMNSMNKLKSREILEILKANILGFTLNWIKNFPGDKELKEKILDFILKYSIEIEKGS